jgi:isopentenyldiphosphate isomerase
MTRKLSHVRVSAFHPIKNHMKRKSMAEEYFDIVNEKNEIVGQDLRRIVHQTGLWHRGVHVFLFTPDGRLLVQKRSQTQDTFPGTLDCSVSEHLKPGESYLDGAIRGLQEELGVVGISLIRLLQFKMNYGPNDNEFSEVYKGVLDEITATADSLEVDEISFYTIPELEEIFEREEPPIAPWFIQLIRWYTGKPTEIDGILWSHQ